MHVILVLCPNMYAYTSIIMTHFERVVIDSVYKQDFLSLYSVMSSASPTLAQVSSFHEKASVLVAIIIFISGSWTGQTVGVGFSLPRKIIQGYQQKHIIDSYICVSNASC